jgi:hypothetical protein
MGSVLILSYFFLQKECGGMRVCWSDTTATKVAASSFPSQAMAMLASSKPIFLVVSLIDLSNYSYADSYPTLKVEPSKKNVTKSK